MSLIMFNFKVSDMPCNAGDNSEDDKNLTWKESGNIIVFIN